MTIQELRRAYAVADALDGLLSCSYCGDVTIFMTEREPVGEPMGRVDISNILNFVGPNDPDGEGWEFYSEREGCSLSNPRVLLDSGEEITLAEAEALLAKEGTAVGA